MTHLGVARFFFVGAVFLHFLNSNIITAFFNGLFDMDVNPDPYGGAAWLAISGVSALLYIAEKVGRE